MVSDDAEFGERLNAVLSPARTIQSPEFLRGREKQLREIKEASQMSGRQIFIHGLRGVGKSSLAYTSANLIQPATADVIDISCEPGTRHFDIVFEAAERALQVNPAKKKVVERKFVQAKLGSVSAGMARDTETGSLPKPNSLNDCRQLIGYVIEELGQFPVILIDEFDQIEDPAHQLEFANLLKMIGDGHLPLRIIFCGIGESIDDLFQSHPSAHRYIHALNLPRLPYTPRFEIIDHSANALGITLDETSRLRIAMVSDGFPHFVHHLCEKLYRQIYARCGEAALEAVPDDFEVAVANAVEAIAPELKKPFEEATRKYTNDYEPILWAVADNHELERNSRAIYDSYFRIERLRGNEPLSRDRFNSRMNNLKKQNYGEILIGTRQGWYSYKEKMLRGYARLRALQAGVILEREHPQQASRRTSRSLAS